MFVALFKTFKSNSLDFPFEEINNLENFISKDSQLNESFGKIEEIFIELQKKEPNAEDSFWTENALTFILIKFNFLAKYKVQAVKEVDYHQIRTLQEFFLHKINFFGLSPKETEQNKIFSQEIKYSTKKIPTDAVIAYTNNYIDGLNLSPFAIDFNNVLHENDTVMCFYSHRDLADNKILNFVSIEDNELKGLECKDITTEENYNKVFSDKEQTTQHKKNLIVQLINDAKTSILGKEDSAEDLLNSLLE
ncbi:MAG: hypothetical protein JXL97_15910 [Bacteroidales bacterium]|nr:hypothetical protein [Bacteroidales bacterium]